MLAAISPIKRCRSKRLAVTASFVAALFFARAAQATVISNLDGQILPDLNANLNNSTPINNWDLYVPSSYYGDGTGQTPVTSNFHGFDNFLGPSDSITIGTVPFHPQSGTDRGFNAARPITGDPALKTGNPGDFGNNLIHYEPLSSLGTGNYGFFMNKNNSNAHGTSQGAHGGWTDFKMSLGSAPANSHQVTVTSRFKIDYVNNGNGLGNGILSLATPNNETVVISVKNYGVSSDPSIDWYGLQVYKQNKVDNPVLVADVENISGDPAHPTATVKSSPGYYTVGMYSDSATHQARIQIKDEFSNVTHNYTIDVTDPHAGDNPVINGSVEFGAGLDFFNNGNSELKMIFDRVKVEAGGGDPPMFGDLNGDGRFDNFDIPAFQLALTDLAAYQATYPNVAYSQQGDMNFDGRLDNFDIPGFQAALTGGAAVVPEPSALTLLMAGLLASIHAGRRSGAWRRMRIPARI